MPLKIELRPGERVVINGAVIEGAVDHRTEFVILNRAVIMRERHILKQENANTPAKRVYFAIQMLYIDLDPQSREQYLEWYQRYYKELYETTTLKPIKEALELINDHMDQGSAYDALKVCRKLIEIEAPLLEMGKTVMEDKDLAKSLEIGQDLSDP